MRDYRHFLFYTTAVSESTLSLGASETHHAAAVLRVKQNDPFRVTDGLGTVYECVCESIVKHELRGIIRSRSFIPAARCSIHLFVGLPERQAFESMLPHLTALQVARISPVITRFCQESWWKGNWEKSEERFSVKMVSALKQSCSAWLPKLDAPLFFDDAVSMIKGPCIVADAEGVPVLAFFHDHNPASPVINCIVGPPGGLAPDELEKLRSQNAVFVKIAQSRLTTELAAVVACSQIAGGLLTPP